MIRKLNFFIDSPKFYTKYAKINFYFNRFLKEKIKKLKKNLKVKKAIAYCNPL